MTSSGSEPDRAKLARLLTEASSAYDHDDIQALIRGILAAPPEIGAGWHRLVADPLTPELAGQLDMLRATMAAGYHDGLTAEDFRRLPRPERLARLRAELAAQ